MPPKLRSVAQSTKGKPGAEAQPPQHEVPEVRPRCGSCDSEANDTGRHCDLCSLWYHIKCQGLTLDSHNFLSGIGDQVKWYCRGCNSTVDNIMRTLAIIKDTQHVMVRDIQENKEKI